ncbi:hypothetical protein GCM10023185_11200 [Hymenobacter saemangeumensis]|uniref:Carbohydrate porin n=1 Tax=Hymenobacter saemangeumensis TaxID=1084522 RepID=A0ABP8I5T4_9BACT
MLPASTPPAAVPAATAGALNQSPTGSNWSLHFQQTAIKQWHTEFCSSYKDSLSLQPRENAKLSLTSTLFIGRKLWRGGAVFFNPEVSGGSGLSGASGVAGATNGETFRIGDPSPLLYLARLYLQQRWALGSETTVDEDELNQLAGPRPNRYLGLIVGKFSIADFFDQNSYSHDPRTQFLNWSLMSAGAWDYPANTRGYTVGAVLEYVSPGLALRVASTAVPTYANGPDLDTNYAQAHSETVELTKAIRLRGRPGALRLLGYRTVAGMGSYAQTLAQPRPGPRPDITKSRQPGRTKTGLVLNLEQELSESLGLFGRLSYNDGQNETWAFTEIDRSACLGFSSTGARWQRPDDRLGLAAVVNGLSEEHRAYLAAGGLGFIVGDGRLSYAPEFIAELFYSLALPKYHASISPDYQLLVNPAYNRDRPGPVHVVALRLHLEF